MRLLVVSDSHGSVRNLRTIIEMHPEADRLIFLGDGTNDLDRLESLCQKFMTNAVRGNNDRYCGYPTELFFSDCGRNILCAHGHTYHVKHSLAMIEHEARRRDVQLVLYGHTHRQEQHYSDGLYVANPGAVMYGEYALVDMLPSGIHISLARI